MYLINLFYDHVQLFKVYQREDCQKLHILGQSYNANDISNADIENTIHPKFSEFRMKVKQTFLLHNHK